MYNLQLFLPTYLDYCRYQKNLNDNTIKAYRIDLSQFMAYMSQTSMDLSRINLSNYITQLHHQYKPKSIKRKIASIKAFFNYLEYEEILEQNPFTKMKIQFHTPSVLPKTIPFRNIQTLLTTAYEKLELQNVTQYKYSAILRDIAVLELLFATGIRVSELCNLKYENIDLIQGTIRIYGKGSKERIAHVENQEVLAVLNNYMDTFYPTILDVGYFFVNRRKSRLSEQSVRFMINKYVEMTGLNLHITPHMFRHTFATLLLEEDVDIRYIQRLLGHSSITTTQIYTHVSSGKQRDILMHKHPRNKLHFGTM